MPRLYEGPGNQLGGAPDQLNSPLIGVGVKWGLFLRAVLGGWGGAVAQLYECRPSRTAPHGTVHVIVAATGCTAGVCGRFRSQFAAHCVPCPGLNRNLVGGQLGVLGNIGFCGFGAPGF